MLEEILGQVKFWSQNGWVQKKTLDPGKSLIGVLWMWFRVSERCLESVWKSGGGQVRTSQVTTGRVRTG